jgi:hypothetical protein
MTAYYNNCYYYRVIDICKLEQMIAPFPDNIHYQRGIQGVRSLYAKAQKGEEITQDQWIAASDGVRDLAIGYDPIESALMSAICKLYGVE